MTTLKDRPLSIDFAAARRAMVDSQLRVSGVNSDFVRERMSAVPREDFVPAGAKSAAYMDRAIPLGGGRFLAAPLVQGMMLEEASPTGDDRVLLVDGGSGYLAELVKPLVGSLEVVTPEQAQARSRKQGDFTLLLIDGAIEHLPEALVARMANDARVVTGLLKNGLTRLASGRKVAGDVALVPLADIGIPVLPEFAAPKGWSF